MSKIRSHEPKYLFLFLLFTACASRKEAAVTRVSDHVRLPMILSSLAGRREGYSAHAEMTFVDAATRDSLVIRFTLEPGVPTRFVRGEYSWQTLSGEVTCSSVDFFGGQGGVPSIGGTFALTTPDGSSYIVYLPTTEMAVKK